MAKRDARLISPDAEGEVRRQAVKLRLEGMSRERVSEIVGVNVSEVTRLMRFFKDGAWAEAHRDRIELVFLPSYSPELNPDEYLNNHLKQTINIDEPARNKDELDLSVRLGMSNLKLSPKTVASFFRHPRVSYAA